MAAVKRLPVYHHSANDIAWSFGISKFILSYLDNRVPLKPVLGGGGRDQFCTFHYWS